MQLHLKVKHRHANNLHFFYSILPQNDSITQLELVELLTTYEKAFVGVTIYSIEMKMWTIYL